MKQAERNRPARATTLRSRSATMIALAGALATAANAQTVDGGSCAALVGQSVEGGTIVAADRYAQGSTILGDVNPASLLFGGDTAVTASTNVCRVKMQLRPTTSSLINAELWLPDSWNQKMVGYGGGGLSGGLGSNQVLMNNIAARGYASVTSDLGHTASPLAIWAWGQPEKVVDWGYRANHVMTLAARQVVQSYYQTQIQRAYFQGCSGGGREAMMEVSRYPNDYNGVIAGSPAMSFGGIMSQQVWAFSVYASAPNLATKLPAVNAAVIKACDALDGVQDGVIENPRRCGFDPVVMRCGWLDTSSCLNDAEIAAVRKLYAGPRLSTGETVLPGFSPGSETQWLQAFLIGYAGGGPEYYKWMVYNNPLWTPLMFNLDTDVPMSRARVEPIGNSDNPDIRAFINAGGKLIMYHGWADEIVPSESSVRFYEAATTLAGPSLSSSARLFMIPGAHHCEAGFDMMPYLEDWVERGQAPDRVINSTQANSVTTTRALCPWPQTAVYNGSGSTSDAGNYTCRAPS